MKILSVGTELYHADGQMDAEVIGSTWRS